jgi:DNA-binding NtrC family response regulator
VATGDLKRVLVVDDERNIRRTLRIILEGEGYRVDEAASAEEGLRSIDSGQYGAVMLDVKLPGMDGLAALAKIMERPAPLPVIMISGHGTIKDAVEAVKRGAYDFLEKPLDRDRIIISVKNCLEKTGLEKRVRDLASSTDEIVGSGPSMQKLLEDINKVAPTNGRVFITGDSGTGKELVARRIHVLSARADEPFIRVNCAAIPSELIESELFGYEKGAFSGAGQRKKGLVELADGGTLFLDEIGDMNAAAQAKVLRVLQTGELSRLGSEEVKNVDVRVLAATNKDILAEIAAGRFREDLYYRLNVVPIHVPPLRERPEIIPDLVEHFLVRYSTESGDRRKSITPEAMAFLVKYPWPGNIRELLNLVERLIIMTGQGNEIIDTSDLPEYLLAGIQAQAQKPQSPAPALAAAEAAEAAGESPRNLKELKNVVERDRIVTALEQNEWNVSKTAAALGIERTNLHKRMKVLGVIRK